MNNSSQLIPGTEVVARGLRWSVVIAESMGQQTLYRLRGMEGAVLGQEIDILHPFEKVEPEKQALRPDQAAPLPNWLVYHQAFLLEQALGPEALLAVQPGRLRIEPYQLVPVLRSICMSRVRLLLADGVGLGKTIQAGLVVTELIARRLAHRILVVSPAGPLMDQWELEMRERFGLRLDVIDRKKLEDIRRGTESGSIPFDYIPLGLISIDFLKQESILEQIERTSYDVIIIDEAHHCAEVGANADREDSLRRRLAEVLARQCDSLILLTATPHDGNDPSFASLCELLDPSLVNGRGMLRGEKYREHVIRRLKKHILVPDPDNPGQKKELFPKRNVKPIPVTPDSRFSSFIDLQRSLLDIVAPELRRAFRNKSYSDVLAWMALLKRSVSTAAACEKTLRVVAERFQQFVTDTAELQEIRRQRIRTLGDYERKLERFGSMTAEQEEERSLLEAEDIAQQLAAMQREIRRGSYKQAKVANVVTHLDKLAQLAQLARENDPKLERLVQEIHNIRKDEPKANILIYTEYVDSQNAVVTRLEQEELGLILTIHGEDDGKTRTATTNRFRTQNNLILVSTDSAAEGLNLHERCHHLIHLELPFNPNRLEQRNGRIDRYGQTAEPQVGYLYLCGTFEERILLRLIAKYEKQRARLTFVPNTLGLNTSADAAQARLLKGLMEEDTKLFRDEPLLFNLIEDDENEGSDEATRELLEEIDRSLHGFRKAAQSYAWLGDAGLNAEEHLFKEAESARQEGKHSGVVELADFVCDAIRLDGGQVLGTIGNDFFTVSLPPQWIYGMDELPGYDPNERLIRLTTKLEITEDKNKNSIGFLGRAHPLVRRALDRVRSLSFGHSLKSMEDPRVSAVKANVSQPMLLYTFLGRVSSAVGRELERVLAAAVTASGKVEFFALPDRWLSWAQPDKAIRTTDVWKNHFKSWADGAEKKVTSVVSKGFVLMANTFIQKRLEGISKDRSNQKDWLRNRADEITGSVTEKKIIQRGLFDKAKEPVGPARIEGWQSIEDPLERLAAFHADSSQKPSARAEAENVIRIYNQRIAHLKSLEQLSDPEIVPLGILMLVPEVPHGL